MHIKICDFLQYNHCKPPTCFGHLQWPSSGRSFYEGYMAKTTKPMYKYKIFSFKYVIQNVC